VVKTVSIQIRDKMLEFCSVVLPTWIPYCTHTHNHFTALWIWPGTTQVSQYQKKHSPTHTYCSHQSALSASSITIQGILPVQFTRLTLFFHNLSPSFLWSTSWPGTIHFILHTFLHPIIVIFSQYMLIPSQPVLL